MEAAAVSVLQQRRDAACGPVEAERQVQRRDWGAVTARQLIQPRRVHAGRLAVVAGAEEGVPALSQAGRELLSRRHRRGSAACVRELRQLRRASQLVRQLCRRNAAAVSLAGRSGLRGGSGLDGSGLGGESALLRVASAPFSRDRWAIRRDWSWLTSTSVLVVTES